MKKKIIGIFVCTLLIATMAIPISAMDREYILNFKPISKDADVPVWEVGDTWTYEMYYFQNGNLNESYSFEVVGDIIYEVVEDTGDTYKLEGSSAGDFNLKMNVGNMVLKPTMFLNIGTEIEIRKSDLALVKWHQFAKGIFLPRLGPIPIPLPVQVHATHTTTFDPAWSIMPFPLYDGKNGTLDPVDFIEEGKTTLYWGLIKIYDGESSWGFSSGLDYTCMEEQVTVPAGNFTAYNVSTEHGSFRSHYAEEVGNSVKQLIHINFSNEVTYYHMELDLKSTTYTP